MGKAKRQNICIRIIVDMSCKSSLSAPIPNFNLEFLFQIKKARVLITHTRDLLFLNLTELDSNKIGL